MCASVFVTTICIDIFSSNGFMSYMMKNLPENAHLVGATSHVFVDDIVEEVRKETRLIWKSDEDVRVVIHFGLYC